jgi:hypothetical protein
MRQALIFAALFTACTAPSEEAPPVPVEARTLGMNDVTMLLPLPASPEEMTTLLRMDGSGDTGGAALVPRALYERLVTGPGDVINRYEDFHIVALRFDLCDRVQPGPCPEDADGRLRVVLQPLASGRGHTEDVALHAFYPIPGGELRGVVDELRVLGGIQGEPRTSPLKVSPALTGSARVEYAGRLRRLVTRYAREDRLLRLTLFAQHAFAAALNWAFRGVERRGDGFADMLIPGVQAPAQRAILLGGEISYDVTPIVDAPPGLALALAGQRFQAASLQDRSRALSALAAVESPAAHSAETVQCVACHVSTFLSARRARTAGVVLLDIEGRYRSSYDLSVAAGVSAGNERSLRALGWISDRDFGPL